MILIFSNSTNIHMGGVEIFNKEFESLLNNDKIEFYRVPSITKIKIIDYVLRISKSLFYILMNYKKIDFILVQYGNFLDILILPLLKLSLKPIRIIAHIGDSWKHIRNTKTKKITNFFLKIFVENVYIITDEQRSFLSHRNISKIHTIINKKYFEKEISNNSNEKYILFLGRICPEKGIDDLIAVYSKLNKEINLPHLKIVGPIEESYEIHVNKLLEINRIQNQVLILKPVYDIDEKIELIDNASILVYPSYADAFPLTVIEAFSRGTCTLASAISETKNFIEFDEFLFVPGNQNELKNKLKNLLFNKESFNNEINTMQNKSMKYAEGVIVKEIIK